MVGGHINSLPNRAAEDMIPARIVEGQLCNPNENEVGHAHFSSLPFPESSAAPSRAQSVLNLDLISAFGRTLASEVPSHRTAALPPTTVCFSFSQIPSLPKSSCAMLPYTDQVSIGSIR